jgi:hypothetical protein
MSENKTMANSCKFMVYNEDGYHECEIMSARFKCNVLCAWFYDLGNPCISFTVTPGRIPQEKPKIELEQPERPFMTEENVPNICPLKYTFKEIDARIFLLDQKFIHSKKHIQQMKEFEKWVKDLPKEQGGEG